MIALIYGITGQDGSYLAELLLDKNYQVVGVVRRTSTDNKQRIRHIEDKIKLVEGDITDSGSVFSIIEKYKPDEIYNLAAQSHVGTSFNQPMTTFTIDTMGELNILEGIRLFNPESRHYFAGSSEQFGNNYSFDPQLGSYQDEHTIFKPVSPYAVAKVASHNLVKVYRESYDLHASVGILFNHESPRRGDNFVTKKIINWIKDFEAWKESCGADLDFLHFDDTHIWYKDDAMPKLRLGNIDASRDWGYAGDYVNAMWLMLQQHTPDDYVIATGKTHTVRDFLEEAFAYIGIDDYSQFIFIDPAFCRPNELMYLCGKPDKAINKLGWITEVDFCDLVQLMMRGDHIYAQKKKYQKLLQEKAGSKAS